MAYEYRIISGVTNFYPIIKHLRGMWMVIAFLSILLFYTSYPLIGFAQTSAPGNKNNIDRNSQTALPYYEKLKSLSLEDCVRIALTKSIEIKAFQNKLRLAKLQSKDANNFYWPNVAAGIEYVADDGSIDLQDRGRIRPFVRLRQVPFNSGVNYRESRNAAINLTIARIDLDRLERRVLSDISEKYFEVYLNQKKFELDQRNEEKTQRNLEELELRYQDGLVAQIKVLQAEALLNSARLNIKKGRNQLDQSTMTLSILMGLPAETKIQIAEPAYPDFFSITWNEAKDIALQNNVELQIYRESVEKMKKLHKTAKWTRWPNFAVDAYIGNDPPEAYSPDSNVGVKFTISQDLFDAGSTGRRIKSSNIEVKNQENLLRMSEERFINGLRLHYNQFMNRKEELLNAKKQLDFARKLADLTDRSFELGASSLKEKIESQDVFQNAEIEYYTAIAKYMMAEFQLKVKMRIDSVSVDREQ
jgi:outer membrane protein TolC